MNILKKPFQCILHLAAIAAMAALVSAGPVRAYTVDPYAWNILPQGGCGMIPNLVIHPKVANVMYIGADVGGLDRWDAVNQKWIPTLDFMRYNLDDNNFGVAGIAVDPSDTTGNIVYAAVGENDWAGGEVMKSTDRGNSWIRNSKGMFHYQSNGDQQHMQRLAVDPSNSNVIYNADRTGLWRSTDGAVTWTKLTSAPTGDQTNLGAASGACGDQMLIIDPTSGTVSSPTRTKRVFLAPVSNIKSVTSATNASPIVITSASTTGFSAGNSVVISGIGGNTAANGTWTVTVINATTFSLNGSTGNGAYTSGGTMYTGTPTNRLFKTEDGGTTWAAMTGGPSQANKAAITTTGILYATDGAGVYKYSGGASGTWTTITPPSAGGYGSIAIDPFNNNNILVFQFGGWQDPLWRSTDGGATWPYVSTPGTNENSTANPSWYPWNWFRGYGTGLAFDPFTQGVVWESDAIAVWKTTNMYASTVQWNTYISGHEEADILPAFISPPTGPTLLYSGAADVQGFASTSLTSWPSHISIGYVPGGNSKNLNGGDFEEADPNFAAFVGIDNWSGPGSGGYTTDGGVTFYDFPSNPTNTGGRIAVSANSRNMVWLVGGQQPPVLYSSDLGATWTASAGAPYWLVEGNAFDWRSPLASDRKNGNKFYIYDWKNSKFDRSVDGGHTFTTVNTYGLPWGPSGWGQKVDLVANPYVEGDLWVSVQYNGLYHSTDSGTTWTKLSNVQDAYMVSFGAGPNSTTPSIYVMGKVDGDSNEGIFRSDNLGVSWFKIDIYQPYPGRGPNVIAGDRRTYGTVYIGTNIGVYYGQRTTATIPSVPINVVATPGNMQVSLSWTPSSGATSYNVKRATVSGGPYTTISSPTSASYVNTGLTNGTAYYYVVSAVNTAGESGNSTQASATPQLAIPAIPTGLAAIGGSAQVSLSWSASVSATAYNVKRATVTGGPYTTVGSPASTSYTNTGLTNGTTYYYVVSAVNSMGESGNSAEANAKPSASNAGIPFTSTAPVIDGSADACWSTATSYPMANVVGTIPTGAVNTGSWQALWDNTNLYLLVSIQDSTVLANNDSIEVYVDGNNGKAGAYTSVDWQWVFVNGGGIQEYQNGVSGSNTTGIAQGQAAITGGWRMEAKIPWATIGVTPFSSDNIGLDIAYNNYNVAGTRANKLFWFSTLDNDWTNPSLFGTANLGASGGSAPYVTGETLGTLRNNFVGWVGCQFTVGGTALTVTDLGRWVVSGNSAAHTVKLVAAAGTDVPGGSVSIATSGATAGAFKYATLNSPVTLTANTAYYIISQEANGGDQWYDDNTSVPTTVTTTSAATVNNSEWWDGSYHPGITGAHCYAPLNFKYTTSGPPAPTGLTPTAGDAQVSLSWSASSGATSYNVKCSTVSGSGYATVASPAVTNYTNTGLINGVTYYYVVSAVNATGESANSAQVSATPVSGTTHSGTWSATAVISGTPSFNNLSQVVNVVSNSNYVASFWLKGSGGISLRIFTGNYGTLVNQITYYATSTWQLCSMSFSTGSSTQMTFDFTDSVYNAPGTCYIDDCFMGVSNGANVLGNPGFESGHTAWVVNTPTFNIAGYGSGNTHDGTWAAKAVVSGTPSFNNLSQVVNVVSNSNYVASFWLKGNGSISLRIFTGNYGTLVNQVTYTATSTWQLCSMSFSTGSSTQMTFGFTDSVYNAPGTCYIDDCFMGVSNGANVLGNPGFESGNTTWVVNNPTFTIVQNP